MLKLDTIQKKKKTEIYLFVIFADMLYRVLYFEKEARVTHMPTYKKYVWIKTDNLLHKNDDINIPPSHSLPAAITKCTQRFLVDRMKFRSGKMTRTTGWLTRRHEGGWGVGQDPLSKWADDIAGGNDNSSEEWSWMNGTRLGLAGASRFAVSSSPFYKIKCRLLRDCTCS